MIYDKEISATEHKMILSCIEVHKNSIEFFTKLLAMPEHASYRDHHRSLLEYSEQLIEHYMARLLLAKDIVRDQPDEPVEYIPNKFKKNVVDEIESFEVVCDQAPVKELPPVIQSRLIWKIDEHGQPYQGIGYFRVELQAPREDETLPRPLGIYHTYPDGQVARLIHLTENDYAELSISGCIHELVESKDNDPKMRWVPDVEQVKHSNNPRSNEQ